MPCRVPISEADDKAYWDAVEEATELLYEERYRDALIELRKVIQAAPENPYAFYFLGIGLYEVGELDTARDAYRAALRLAPEHMGARIALSHILRQLGDAKEAIVEASRALSQVPGDPDALHAVGLAYLERGDAIAAQKYLAAYLDTRPELEVATEVRAILYRLSEEKN